MPHDIQEIITRISPGKYDAQRAARFDIERAKGALVSRVPAERILNIDRAARTVELSLATDQPCEEWFGMLELDVSPGSVMLDRVNNGVAPLLVNHDVSLHPGTLVANSVNMGPQVRCIAKFSRSQLGEDMLNDVEDGIRVGTSVGFLVHDMVLLSANDGEMPSYRATKWEILEVSLASVPADPNCGVGRSFERPISDAPEQRANSNNTENNMPDIDPNAAPAAAPSNAAAPAAALAAPATRSAAELVADEITRWGGLLSCPELAQRYLTDSFAEERDITVDAFKRFVKDNKAALQQIVPTTIQPPAQVQERFTQAATLGEQIVNCEAYKRSIAKGKIDDGMRVSFDANGFLNKMTRSTFTSTGTGLDTTINYLNTPIVLLEQQRLTVRDLLPVGETTQSAVVWIKEDTYTNSADMVAEEGEKPEASFDTGSATTTVKKIAVVAKVSDEMWADFPMLRDYINTRLRFMVQAKEEDELLNGTGSGNNLTGLMNASGIQSQACGSISATNPVVDSIFKAMTKVRTATGTTGGWEPDGLVINPTDYQIIRLSKDGQNQYYGGGPFYGAYSSTGGVNLTVGPWGLRTVVTTAIAAGTALVGAFGVGAQIWQREGIRVDATNTNEDDFNFNRISLRVEERLALAIYRGSAFCKVTSIA